MRNVLLTRVSFSCALALVLSITARSRADGLIYQLPEDGRWVRFQMTMQPEAGEQGAPPKMAASFTMRSVGQEIVEGDKCRWIELELVPQAPQGAPNGPPQGPPRIIVKVLLPEKNLRKGQEPLARIVKGWLKEGNEAAQEFKDPTSERGGPVPAFLSGPLEHVKTLDKKSIDTKIGTLDCAGISADKEYKQSESVTTVQFETRLHEKAPFGVVSSKMHYASKHGDRTEKGTVTLNLDDAGMDAKSGLPDQH